MDYHQIYKDTNGNEHLSQSETVRRKVAALRSLYRYLYKNEMINSNPTKKLMLHLYEKV